MSKELLLQRNPITFLLRLLLVNPQISYKFRINSPNSCNSMSNNQCILLLSFCDAHHIPRHLSKRMLCTHDYFYKYILMDNFTVIFLNAVPAAPISVFLGGSDYIHNETARWWNRVGATTQASHAMACPPLYMLPVYIAPCHSSSHCLTGPWKQACSHPMVEAV